MYHFIITSNEKKLLIHKLLNIWVNFLIIICSLLLKKCNTQTFGGSKKKWRNSNIQGATGACDRCIDRRSGNQYLMPNELNELEGREGLGTHHINGALPVLRLVCSLFFVRLDSKVQQTFFLHQFFWKARGPICITSRFQINSWSAYYVDKSN